ncbi:Hypothetical predicted protein [Paramuricea clavata]|uniref:Uncharacterized protein n=1 Tax=Paramuricea clavata TaxID=317549 RepID=A0A7D9IG71_PARCT|nr:Hypothetical predicted protein [Paramuricea clavata]
MDDNEVDQHKDTWKFIKKHLNDMKEDWAAWYDSTDIDNYPLETNLSDNDDNNEEESEQKNKKDLKPELFEVSVLTRKLTLKSITRDEITNLLGNCASYQEHYFQVKNTIDEQMKCYAMCSEDLNVTQDQLNNVEDSDENYDLIAPGTQNIEHQDEDAQELHPEFNETYDLSGDLVIPSAASNTEQLILHEEQDVYRGMVQKLNREQKEFFFHVLHLIKTSDNPFYCFLSGGAGVGKSHVTKCLYQAALKYYNNRAGDDFHQVKILMLAPTGKAAYNIKGKNLDNSEYAVPTPNKWQDNFNMFELEEIMCQRESKVFAEILNRLREGKHTKNDILKLKERLIKENNEMMGERTEIALNVCTDDGMTNGAGNVVKKIQLNQIDKPSGIIWVQFDHSDVGEKTRHENRHLYVQVIESTWTPIKPITTQFVVGRNHTAQVVRKQFPLRPAEAKTIHRSQELTLLKKAENETFTDYILWAETASTALKAAKEVISDGLLIAMVLKGLPSAYKNFLCWLFNEKTR